MTIKFNKSNHDVKNSKCVRNVGQYKVYADHFNAASAYTNYYVEDTETGEVVEYKEHYSYMGSALSEIVEQVSKYGFEEPPAPQVDPDAFDPLA